MTNRSFEVHLPEWLDEAMRVWAVLPTRRARMTAAITLARQNIEHGTGGPFGAVVVHRSSGRLLSAGVNLVVPNRNCTAHAEMVAIELAEAAVGDYDLGGPGGDVELVSTVEPCAMCLGAIVWSGVSSVVCGATSGAAAEIGFDEGPRPRDWVAQLECRGIEVVRGVGSREAADVLTRYAAGGGEIYNAGR